MWGLGGADYATREVCAHCGMFRETVSEHEPPGTHARVLERITYEDATPESEEWAGVERDEW